MNDTFTAAQFYWEQTTDRSHQPRTNQYPLTNQTDHSVPTAHSRLYFFDSRISSCSVRIMKSESIRPNFWQQKPKKKKYTKNEFSFALLLLFCAWCSVPGNNGTVLTSSLHSHNTHITRSRSCFCFFFPIWMFSLALVWCCFRAPTVNSICGSGVDTEGAHVMAFECMNSTFTLFWPTINPINQKKKKNENECKHRASTHQFAIFFLVSFRTFNFLNGLFAYENVMILRALPFECFHLNDDATEAHCSLNRSNFNISILLVYFILFIFTSHETIHAISVIAMLKFIRYA